MILKYNDYIKEYWDWKNIFRSKDNPNVLADNLFEFIKKDIKENVYILTSVNKIEDGFIEMELSNKAKLKILLIYEDDGKPKEGIITLKQYRKKGETELIVDYNKAKKYIDYILSKTEKNINKAKKSKTAKDIRDFIK